MTPIEVRDRGYNLMLSTFLLVAGLGFGTVGFNEADTPDKLDDFLLLGIGIIAVLWYRFSGMRTRRTLIPVGLLMVAVAAQLLGVFLEADDSQALGDNIGGMLFYVPFTAIALWEYLRPLKLSP